MGLAIDDKGNIFDDKRKTTRRKKDVKVEEDRRKNTERRKDRSEN